MGCALHLSDRDVMYLPVTKDLPRAVSPPPLMDTGNTACTAPASDTVTVLTVRSTSTVTAEALVSTSEAWTHPVAPFTGSPVLGKLRRAGRSTCSHSPVTGPTTGIQVRSEPSESTKRVGSKPNGAPPRDAYTARPSTFG